MVISLEKKAEAEVLSKYPTSGNPCKLFTCFIEFRLEQDNKKSTRAGEYLASTLNGFDLQLYDGLAATFDIANKLLMLV
nr:kinesin-like protein KIN-14B [Tanacetum cinerariifolium]